MKHLLSCVILLAATSSLSAQSNATTQLMTYGDTLGGPFQAVATGLTPNATTFLVPSFVNTGSSYLVGLSGDPDDFLTVGIDLAIAGTYFQGSSDANGRYTRNLVIPNNPAWLDRPVYMQAFTQPGGGGADMFQDFTWLRTVSLNTADRWQAAQTDMPVSSANVAFAVTRRGERGGALEVYVCGGGPALLTDPQTSYMTEDRIWRFDAASEQWALASGTMTVSRAFHTATVLQDGKLLVCGGVTFGGQNGGQFLTRVLDTAELYDPVQGTFTPLPPMNEFRAGHTASLLPDGRVLIAGGTEGDANHELYDVTDILGTAHSNVEFFDPGTMSFSYGPNMPEPKAGQTAVTLQDGRILLAGGITHVFIIGIPIPDFSNQAAIYDPGTNAYTQSGMQSKRALFGATLLQNGRVLVAGGAGGDIFNIGPIPQCEVYNPAMNQFTSVQNLPGPAAFSRVVTLEDGRALIVGGAVGDLVDPIPTAAVAVFDPSSGAVAPAGSMQVAHGGGVVVLAEDGSVLVGGGESNSGTATSRSESYTP